MWTWLTLMTAVTMLTNTSCDTSATNADGAGNKEPIEVYTSPPRQPGHEISITINGLQNEDIYLAYHFGSQQYILDTLTVDETGTAVKKGEDWLTAGIYMVVLPSKNYFEIIVNEQHFSVTNDTTDLINNFSSKGTKENEVFYEYVRFVNGKQKKRQELNKQLNTAEKEKEKEAIKDELKALNEEVREKENKIFKKYPDLFYTKILMAMRDPEVPEEAPENAGENWEYYWYKAHYFDNIDMTDSAMLRTPVLHNKVMYYMNKVSSQMPDSLCASAERVVELARPNDEIFRYFMIRLLNKYANSKVMGHDAVYVCIGDKYYCKEDSTTDAWWTDPDDLYRICDRVNSLRPTLIGKPAPQFTLRNKSDQFVPLAKIRNRFVMLFFYDPDCGHCKKETPKMVKAVKELEARGINITPVWISTAIEKEKWIEFIGEFGLNEEGWYNLADVHLQSPFRELYDIQSTPRKFLLDENHKIIAKQFNHEQLGDFIDNYEKKVLDEQNKAQEE